LFGEVETLGGRDAEETRPEAPRGRNVGPCDSGRVVDVAALVVVADEEIGDDFDLDRGGSKGGGETSCSFHFVSFRLILFRFAATWSELGDGGEQMERGGEGVREGKKGRGK
jgi:hypothetical protein